MPSLRGGGAERTLINLLQKIDYERYEIDLVVVSKFGTYIDQVPENVKLTFLFSNILVARILTYLHRKLNFSYLFKRKMRQFDDNYDVGISFLDSNFTDLLFFLKNSSKRVVFIHGSYKSNKTRQKFYQNNRRKNSVYENRYKRLDSLYFVSEDSRDEFIDIFNEFPNMGVIYNIIDRSSVIKKSKEDEHKNGDDRMSFVAVGSLLPVKGFDMLIRAAKIVRDKGYDFIINLVGSGPEENKLKLMVNHFQLENQIKFHGFLSNPYPVMRRSDVFVMSSVSEALPTVLCEAMILGKPTMVTNCPGCRGLVESGEYGLMAEQDDQDLAEKMMMYMDNPDLLRHYSRKSLERAELFDDDRVLQAYYDLFDGKEPVVPE